MFCPKCGNECGDVAVCPTCGAQVTEPQNTQENNAVQAPVAPVAPVAPAAPSGFAPVVPQQPSPKKGFSPKFIILPAIALLIIGAIVLGCVAVGFVASPQVQVASNLNKLLFKVESFDFEVEYTSEGSYTGEDYYGGYYEREYLDKTTVTGAIAWGDDITNTSLFADANYEYETNDTRGSDYSYSGTGTLNVVSDKGKILVYGEEDGEQMMPGISVNLPSMYKDVKNNYEDLLEEYYGITIDDVEEELQDETNTDINVEKLIYWVENIVSKNNLNEKVIEEIYDEFLMEWITENTDLKKDEIPDYKTFKKVLTKFILTGISEDAFEVKDKFKEDGIKKYEIKVRFDHLAEDFYEFIKDNKDLKEFLDTDIGEEFLDSLEESVDEDYFSGENVEFIIGFSKGYLAYFEYTEKGSDWKDTVKITLSNFNKADKFTEQYNKVYKKTDEWYSFENIDDLEQEFDY